MPAPPQYSDDDIKAIIQRAIENQGGAAGGVSHDDLLAIGGQVGLSPAVMERAAREFREARLDAEARGRVLSARKRWLWAHAALFAVLNALFFTVNALTTPGEWWFLFPVVFWGLALGAHAGVALGAGVSEARLKRERARVGEGASSATRPQLRVDESRSEQDIDANLDAEVPREVASKSHDRRA